MNTSKPASPSFGSLILTTGPCECTVKTPGRSYSMKIKNSPATRICPASVPPCASYSSERMHIHDIFAQHPTTFSFEFFPPKTDAAAEELFLSIARLQQLKPSFV